MSVSTKGVSSFRQGVSVPNKKPAVQTKKPKKYARKAPRRVPLSFEMAILAAVVGSQHCRWMLLQPM